MFQVHTFMQLQASVRRMPSGSGRRWQEHQRQDAKGIEERPQDDTHGWCPVISLGTGHQDPVHLSGDSKASASWSSSMWGARRLAASLEPQTVVFASAEIMVLMPLTPAHMILVSLSKMGMHTLTIVLHVMRWWPLAANSIATSAMLP